MSSSIKPPIAPSKPVRKFQFDVDFKQEDERTRNDSSRQHQHEVPLEEPYVHPPAKMFSEEEVDAIREEVVQAGLRQGRMETLQEIEQSIALLTNNLVDKIALLLEAELTREKMAREVAIRTTLHAIKKIWPQVLNHMGLDLVENTIRQSMEYNPEEPRIVVRVHDTLLDEVIKRLPKLQDQQAFAGKVIIIADQHVTAGDCRIEWADGGLDRLSRTLSQQLDAALDRVLSSLHSPSQNNDAERISL